MTPLIANESDRCPVITGITYELGELVPITDLAGQEDEDAIEILLAAGLDSYARASRRVSELASACMSRTLKETGIDPAEVDIVIYVTESFWDASKVTTLRDTNRQHRQDIFRAIYDVGLKDAFPFGLTFSGCGGFVSAAKIASSMLMAGQARNVLIVTCDRHPPDLPRVLPPAVAVISDGAASCLLSLEARSGFAVKDVCQKAYLSAGDVYMEDDFGRFLMDMSRSVRTLGAQMRNRTGLDSKACRRLLINNYSLSTVRVFSHLLEYQTEQVYLDNVPRIGHVYSSDSLINLSDLDRAGGIEVNDHVLILGTGPVTSGLIAVQKVAA